MLPCYPAITRLLLLATSCTMPTSLSCCPALPWAAVNPLPPCCPPGHLLPPRRHHLAASSSRSSSSSSSSSSCKQPAASGQQQEAASSKQHSAASCSQKQKQPTAAAASVDLSDLGLRKPMICMCCMSILRFWDSLADPFWDAHFEQHVDFESCFMRV